MSKHPTLPYLRFIDGLRAIAVVAVIIYHLHPSLLPGGFVGVDIFFVISEFVVSRSTSGWGSISLPRLLAQFYARRIIRIVPALLVCLLMTTLVSVLLVPYAFLSGTIQRTGLAAFFGFSNVILAATANDYFSPRSDFNTFTHTWSLAVEEQFYLVFPWLFVFWLRARRIGVSELAFAVAALLSLVISWHLSPDRAFYLIYGRFWELAVGVVLYQVTARLRTARLSDSLATMLVLLSIVMLAVSLTTTSPRSTPFPGSILPILGTLGILFCGTSGQAENPIIRLFNGEIIGYIGRISYSLYLWHWPVFVLFRWTVGLEAAIPIAAALTLTVLLSIGSFHFIENPARRYFPLIGLPTPTVVGVGLVIVGLGWAISSGLWSARAIISLSVVNRHQADWYGDDRRGAVFAGKCRLITRGRFMPAGAAETVSRSACDEPIRFPHRLFVLGDSHASAYEPMLKRFVMRTGGVVELYSAGGCAFFSMLYPVSPDCKIFESTALADAAHIMKSGDVVFLPALRLPRIADQFAYFGQEPAQAEMFSPAAFWLRQAQTKSAAAFARDLESKGLRVVFEAPLPIFSAPAFRCADWFNRANPICAGGLAVDRGWIDALRKPIMRSFASLQSEDTHIQIWDPLPIVCPGSTCSAFRDDRPLFFDADHLSGFGNSLLEPDFEAFILGLDSQ